MLSRAVTPEGRGPMFPAPVGRGAPAGSHPAPPGGSGSRPVTPEGVGPRPTTPEGMDSVFQGPPVSKVRMPVGSFRPNLPSRPAPTLVQRASSQVPVRRVEAPVVPVTTSGPRQDAPPVRPPSSGQAVSVTASGAGEYTNNLLLQTRIAQLNRKGREQQEENRKLEEEYRTLVARLPQEVTSEGGPNQPDGVETAAPGDGVAVPNGDDVHDGADSGDDAASLASNFSQRGQRGSSLSVSFAPDEGIEQIIPPGARVETEVSFVPGSGDGSQEGEQSGPDPLQSDLVVVSNAAELQGGDVLGPGRHEQRRFPGIPNLRELMTEASPSRVRALTLRDETVALAESEMFPSEVVDRSLLGSRDVPVADESPDSSYRAVGMSLLGSGIQSSTPVIPGTVLRGRMEADGLGVTPVTVEKVRVEQSRRVAPTASVPASRDGRRNLSERERLQAERRDAEERVRLQAERRNARVAARNLPREVLHYSHVEASTDDSDNVGEGTPPRS